MSEWVTLGLAWLGVPAGETVHWAHPEWFALGGLIPLWLLGRQVWHRWRQVPVPADDLRALSQAKVSRFRHPLWSQFLQTQHLLSPKAQKGYPWGISFFRAMILLLAIVAMAQPYWLKTPAAQTQKKMVRDIMFVIESSVSFVLPDYQLNGQPATRMQVVKNVLDPFIAQLQGNRIGLTVYAEQAYTLLPLTADTTAARLTLKRLRPNLAGRTDEGIGAALGLALQQADRDSSNQTPLTRILVLISDGINRPSRLPLSDIMTYAKAMSVPIYVIGVGSGSYQADPRQLSGLIYQPLEAAPLKQLAEATGGAYYQIGSRQALQQGLRAIDQAAGVPLVGGMPPKQKIFLSFWPLAAALTLWGGYTLFALWWLQRRARVEEEPV